MKKNFKTKTSTKKKIQNFLKRKLDKAGVRTLSLEQNAP